MSESFDVISVGAVLVDMIALVDEFPGRDGESFVNDFKFMPGGAAANVAVLCSRLGLKTAFSGKIGKDIFGDLLLSDLEKEKVHVKNTIVISKNISTGSCYICVNKSGDRMIMAYSGAADTLTIDDLPLELFAKAKWVNLSDLRNVASIEALLESDIEINFSMSPGALIAQNPSRAFRLAQHAKLIVASVDAARDVVVVLALALVEPPSNALIRLFHRAAQWGKGTEGHIKVLWKSSVMQVDQNVKDRC